ncbi:unnamed protein product [Bemisia tabaci]|uniref:Uncharacterized protein n=1 Tax=Bemisia tabaci TaxID=7038 RepID=A0A9P0AER4_BEMTA|nr:unnamed protein product [Bemisia tabaci]
MDPFSRQFGGFPAGKPWKPSPPKQGPSKPASEGEEIRPKSYSEVASPRSSRSNSTSDSDGIFVTAAVTRTSRRRTPNAVKAKIKDQYDTTIRCIRADESQQPPLPVIEQEITGDGRCFTVTGRKVPDSTTLKEYLQEGSPESGRTLLQYEEEFWRGMALPPFSKRTYAADLTPSEARFGGPPAAVLELDRIPSLLDGTKAGTIAGVGSQYLYYGKEGTVFAYHLEDSNLLSINIHMGIQMEIYARSHGRDLGRLLKERGAGTDLKVDVAMTKEPTEIVREMDLERVRRLSHLLQIQMEIYASSHGRDLGRLLRERGAGTDLKVECYPSGKFNEVTENIRPRKEAVTVIIAGGNDVTVTKEPTEIIGEMNLERVRRLSERQNGGLVVFTPITGVPYLFLFDTFVEQR